MGSVSMLGSVKARIVAVALVAVIVVAVLMGTGTFNFTSGGIIVGSPTPGLQRHDDIVIEKYRVQLPQTCLDPDKACTCSDWTSESFQLNKGEIIALQMEVVPEVQGARGEVTLSLDGPVEQGHTGVYSYVFYDNEAVGGQSNSFKVADAGHYFVFLSNCENSTIAVSFKLTVTASA